MGEPAEQPRPPEWRRRGGITWTVTRPPPGDAGRYTIGTRHPSLQSGVWKIDDHLVVGTLPVKRLLASRLVTRVVSSA